MDRSLRRQPRLFPGIIVIALLGAMLFLLWPGALLSPISPLVKEFGLRAVDRTKKPNSPVPEAGTSPFKGTQRRLPIVINTHGRVINAVRLFWRYNLEDIEVTGIDTYISPFFIEPPHIPLVDSSLGQLVMAGAMPNPGWRGNAVIGYIDVALKRPVTTEISLMTDQSFFYLNDGQATKMDADVAPIISDAR